MKNNTFIIFLTACLFAGCGQRAQNNDAKTNSNINTCTSTIDSMTVIFKNYFRLTTALPVSCNQLLDKKSGFWGDGEFFPVKDGTFKRKYFGIIDTCVTDCEALLKIEEGLKTIKPGDYWAFYDARMVAIIYFKDGTQTTLCACDFFAMDIYQDGILTEKNPRLVYLLKLYSGFYSWFTKDEMRSMRELEDTTYIEPIMMTAETNPRIKEIVPSPKDIPLNWYNPF
jgi:hypothetical protein